MSMTPEEHNRTLGILHMVYGGLHLLMIAFAAIVIWAMMGPISREPNGPPMAFLFVMLGFMLLMSLIFGAPSFVAGFGMLKRRKWAKTASIVAGVVEGLSFPLGSALCVYTLWFSFGEAGKSLYDENYNETSERLKQLNRARDQMPWYREERVAQEQPRESRPTYPGQPPNWRD